MKQVLPYADTTASKTEQVSRMFDEISPKYDLLNHTLSMGIDKGWRRKVVAILKKQAPKNILDIATGTADLAIAEKETGASAITGIDISEGMLKIGRQKIDKLGLNALITLQLGDSENIQYPDNSFDAVTVSFGVRNFEHLEVGLSEIYRVLRPGGTLVILEFSQPDTFPIKQLYNFYFHNVLPLIGRMVSKSSRAYTYLPESVTVFPYGKKFTGILDTVGFKDSTWKKLSLGIASIYTAKK